MDYTVLKKPLTEKAMSKQAIASDGELKGVLAISIGDVIASGGVEGWNDLLSTRLTGTELLTDISWRVVGSKGNTLHVEARGDVSMIEAEWPVELRRQGCRC